MHSVDQTITPINRTLRFLQRARRRDSDTCGPLRSLAQIAQAVGADKETVRGYLIKLLASGEIEFHNFSSGQSWSAPKLPEPVRKEDAADGHYILQREIMDDPRGLWFDAETFTNSTRAKCALDWARRDAEFAARQFGNSSARVQRIRMLSVPA